MTNSAQANIKCGQLWKRLYATSGLIWSLQTQPNSNFTCCEAFKTAAPSLINRGAGVQDRIISFSDCSKCLHRNIR